MIGSPRPNTRYIYPSLKGKDWPPLEKGSEEWVSTVKWLIKQPPKVFLSVETWTLISWRLKHDR